MSHKLSVYLDTSVINFLFADDAPEKREITLDFFDNFVKLGIYEVYVSDFVIQEINQTQDLTKLKKLLAVIENYPIDILTNEESQEIDQLAELYLINGVIPPKKLYDALHVACTVIHKINFLVSWNYKHLANVNRERRIIALNYENNYLHPIRIITPLELIDYEK
ncbi:MAG: PIN domain-containing protein [Microscillaceae bacterium]|jgi:predicted nucleic acid-binding protein|nr:PIN domain-containing protein [Microscillaceae bacterium]